jgi:hypothetical protein
MSKIDFYYNGSFVGTNHSMTIDGGEEIPLGGIVSNEKEAKEAAIRILKENYNIEYTSDDINFKWGGRL